MDIIERAALAAINSDRVAGGLHPLTSRGNVPDSEGYVRNVHAILEAIREPSPAMIDRFVSRALQVSVSGEGGWSRYAVGQWQAMIDGALTGEA